MKAQLTNSRSCVDPFNPTRSAEGCPQHDPDGEAYTGCDVPHICEPGYCHTCEAHFMAWRERKAA